MARRPDIHHQADELASTLPPLLVAADRVAATISQGVHGRRRVGQGESFWQFRRYQSGDPAQLIDWRQSAKSQPLYVRENEWEAAQSVWLWRDFSASMHYRSVNDIPTKVERANLLLLALASLLVRGGEHVAMLGGDAPPGSGRAALHRLAVMIEEGRTAPDNVPAFVPLPRDARVVLIGDFLTPVEEIKAAVDRFAGRGVRGHLFPILDPAEEALPFDGRVRFEGMEGEGDVLIGKVEAVRETYLDVLAAHNRGVEAVAHSMGWTFATHHTNRPPETALLALFLVLSAGSGG